MTGKLRGYVVGSGGPSSKSFERVQFPDTMGLQPLCVKQVSCTSNHALVVTTGGALFSWGEGIHGQLGHGATENDDVPRLVRTLEGVPIESAAAGDCTSLALACSGEMWSWGEGPALGHGEGGTSTQLLPKVIEGLPPGASVVRIAAGRRAACVRADGTTLSWGRFLYDHGPLNKPTPLE